MENKEQLLDIIKNMSDKNAERLLKYINDNFELVVTEEDKKAIERAKKEIQKGEFDFI